MAKKAKKVAKKRSAKNAKKKGAKVQLNLTANQRKKADDCMKKSGKIELGFKTVSVTKLPKSIAPVATFVD